MARLLLERARCHRQRIRTSLRVHPELANPRTLSVYLDAFRQVSDELASTLERKAADLLQEVDHG